MSLPNDDFREELRNEFRAAFGEDLDPQLEADLDLAFAPRPDDAFWATADGEHAGFVPDPALARDLARGKALALRLLDTFDAELAAVAGLAGGHPGAAVHLRTAAAIRDEWRAEPEPADLFVNASSVARFAAAISQAQACLTPVAVPCLFDPYHGPATAEAVWTPGPTSLPRPVPCCADDAGRLAAGAPPRARQVPTLEGMVPLWDCADEVHAYWMFGHFTLSGTDRLRAPLAGTGLGHTLARIMRYAM